MSRSSHPAVVRAVVDRLRAAGCVFAEDEAALLIAATGDPGELEARVSERVVGVPLEYILGWAEFCGLRVAVEPNVFVPRRRTEFLVQRAIALLQIPGKQQRAVVLDLCCGSGAIGAALLASVGPLELHATDLEPAAVRCARGNIGAAGRVYEGNLFEPLPLSLQGRIDLLAANVPYVPTAAVATMPPEARDHEARSALDGGPDGLDLARRVVAAAPGWLAPGGHVLIETAADQTAQLQADIIGAGLNAQVVSSEQFDATVVLGTRP